MTQAITRRLGFFLVLLVMLAACGSASNPAAAPAPTGAAVQRPTSPPTALAAQPSASQPPATTTQLPATAAPAPATATIDEGIAQGLTPEGYHFLGRADAPVTFQDFSDFL